MTVDSARSELEFHRMVDLAAQTLQAALEAMPDELWSGYPTPIISLLNAIAGPASRASMALHQRQKDLRATIPFIMMCKPVPGLLEEHSQLAAVRDRITPTEHVHIVAFPAADGDGVRMTAYHDEAAANESAKRLTDDGTKAWLHTLRVNA